MSQSSKPDITFYYSVDTELGATFEQQPIGPNIIQYFKAPLYDVIPSVSPNLGTSIGSTTFTTTLFDINNTTGNYDTIEIGVFYLPNGSITFTPNILFIKDDKTGYYLAPADTTNVYNILSGTDEYLNCKGFIEIITDAANIIRTINIYFLKTFTATASASATKIDCDGNITTVTETASASSLISAEDAQQIAKTVAQGLVNALT